MARGADSQLDDARDALRRVVRGLWRHRRPPDELLELLHAEPSLGRRHVLLLSHVGRDGPLGVSALADAAHLSLPAASSLVRDLEEHGLVTRREDPDDRRRTLVALDTRNEEAVQRWLRNRDEPLRRTLAALDEGERAAFVKGIRTLADELLRESSCGPVRPHHRAPRR
jgi:DNA-binding MarR family transcriptional regulator